MSERRKLASTIGLLLVILLAFALRVYRLDAQSMWSDEGLSLYRAMLPLRDVLANTIVVDGVVTKDTNPAFYFLLLNLLRRLGGESVFVLRYFSVLAGVLSVPLIFLLGRLVHGRLVGLAAALFLAISPFHVWMSQELRNYTLLVFFNLLAVYALGRFILRREGESRRGWLLVWGGASLLGVYTHYFGFFVLALGLLLLAAFLIWERWRAPLWLLGASGAVLLLLVPVIPRALERFRAGQQVDFFFLPPGAVIQQALDAFAVGISPSLRHPDWRVWPVVALAVIGLLLLLWQRRWRATVLLVTYAAVPMAILLLLSQLNPLYNGPRHALLGLPPFLLLVAIGVMGWSLRWRALPWILGLFLLASQGHWLWVQYHDPALAKDDVRAAAEFLNQHAGPDDLVVLHDTLIQFTFNHYYGGSAPVIAVPELWQQDVVGAAESLAGAGRNAERVWFLVQPQPRTGFPRDVLVEWAEAEWPRFADLTYAGLWLRVALNGYTPRPDVEALPEEAERLDVQFGDALRLHGVTMPVEIQAGELNWPVLYLSRLNPDPGDFTLSFRFLDESGRVWQQVDGLLWRRYPPDHWPEGKLQRYDHPAPVAAGLPPGEYELQLRVLDPALQALPLTTGGYDLSLGRVSVSASDDPAALPEHTAQSARLGPLRLLGYRLPAAEVRPGHVLPLALFWQARRTPGQDYQVRVEMMDEADQSLAMVTSALSRADYPASRWAPEEVLQGQVDLAIPARADAGDYTLRVSLVDPEAERTVGRSIALNDPVRLVAWPMETELPDRMYPWQAVFGDPGLIEFAGYDRHGDLSAETLDLTLYWRALSDEIPTNYKVFLHLINEDGELVAQADALPTQGVRPSSGWRAGEVLVDPHRVVLPDTLPPGTYSLFLGLYDPDTLVRLPVFVFGEEQPDGRILLERWEQ